MITVFFKLLTQ